MTNQTVQVVELRQEHLPFLLKLWHTPHVMRYADELPGLRGWSKSDDPRTAWAAYQQRHAALGNAYTQLILHLADGTPIGESFFAPLPEGYTFGKWHKPEGILCLMGDIKLEPPYWGRGLGTEGMQRVVAWLFANTACALLMVPPHRKNPAAERVYEKAGFELYTGMRSYRNHKVMELRRERHESIKSSHEGR
jgi:RimJ/RimL family protein N-acetyltransferase